MSSLPTSSAATAAFDPSPTFEPAVSAGTVALTGNATNAAAIANIEFYDGKTDLGGTGQFSGSAWQFTEKFGAGRHAITAVVTDVDGTSYAIAAPYQFVTGVRNEPYVYQVIGESSAGVIDGVSNFDGSGNLVSHTAVAVNGAGAAPFNVAFDPTTTFLGSTEGLITGTTSSYGAASTIEVFEGTASQTVDPGTGTLLPGAKALGYAVVNGDGSWSFDAHVSPGKHVFTAVAASLSGLTAVSQSSFTLITGVTGAPYVYQEIDHDASGAVSATTSYAADGTIVGLSAKDGLNVQGGSATGEVFRSSYDDVMTSDGQGSTTFLFTSGFGQDEITNFNYTNAQLNAGISHDIISLPQADFANLAQVFRHTAVAPDGSAVIHIDPTDTIKIDNVTKRDLITHPNVISLQG